MMCLLHVHLTCEEEFQDLSFPHQSMISEASTVSVHLHTCSHLCMACTFPLGDLFIALASPHQYFLNLTVSIAFTHTNAIGLPKMWLAELIKGWFAASWWSSMMLYTAGHSEPAPGLLHGATQGSPSRSAALCTDHLLCCPGLPFGNLCRATASQGSFYTYELLQTE